MRLAVAAQRISLVEERGLVDIATASDGEFGPDPLAAYDRWDDLVTWVQDHRDAIDGATATPLDTASLDAPVPAPRQVFAIGLNYRAHAAEAGLALPEGHPVVFTKFPSSVTGPRATVELPSEAVDFEAELVVVIGRRAHRVSHEDGWAHVAGLTLGQDLSERVVQFRGLTPQFSLGKSYPGFSPTGPVLVTPDEFDDPDAIALGCSLNGEQMQSGRTDDLVFDVPNLVEQLSAVVPLLPGDLVFTGTPAGIGWARDPRVVLRPGDTLTTTADLIGEMTTTFTSR
ncbi:fumarylacetoacetate hydrolase family protein [Angustibacter speluncae]